MYNKQSELLAKIYHAEEQKSVSKTTVKPPEKVNEVPKYVSKTTVKPPEKVNGEPKKDIAAADEDENPAFSYTPVDIYELERRLERKNKALQNHHRYLNSNASKLPDNGAKMKQTIREDTKERDMIAKQLEMAKENIVPSADGQTSLTDEGKYEYLT